jgi:YggT family protein
MAILKVVLTYLLEIYLLLLIGTMVISWLQAFARDWEPKGIVLVICESVLSATDPPLKFLRRHIRPFRLGTVALDLSFMIVFIVVLILLKVVVPVL